MPKYTFSFQELQMALDCLWSRFDRNAVPSITVTRGKALPYVDSDGLPITVAIGTENTTPDEAGRAAQQRAAPITAANKVTCRAISNCSATFTRDKARHHAARHIEFDLSELKDSNFLCGQCAAFSAVQSTEDHASQEGCTVGLVAIQKTIKVRGQCKSYGDLGKIFGSWKPAQNCTEGAPSTSVPLVCPACPHKRTLCSGHPKTKCLFSNPGKQAGIIHWSHNMAAHWRAAHQANLGPMPVDLADAIKRKLTNKGVDELKLLTKE